jgi:hypothetical protein
LAFGLFLFSSAFGFPFAEREDKDFFRGKIECSRHEKEKQRESEEDRKYNHSKRSMEKGTEAESRERDRAADEEATMVAILITRTMKADMKKHKTMVERIG